MKPKGRKDRPCYCKLASAIEFPFFLSFLAFLMWHFDPLWFLVILLWSSYSCPKCKTR